MTTIIIDRSSYIFAGALDFRSISFVLNERSVCAVHPEKSFLPWSNYDHNKDILSGCRPFSHNESYVVHVESERSPQQNQRGSNKSYSFLQNAIPKLGFECFKDHPQRNMSIKWGNPITIFKVEMLVDDVFSIFPLQSNGTLPARLTAGGIHGQNILLNRAKFSSRRSVVSNGSGRVVCCVSNMAFQNGASIFMQNFSFFPKFTTEISSEVY